MGHIRSATKHYANEHGCTLSPYEPRSSLAILRGGYNLDSFMVRYQGVDWTNEANWECNARCCLCPCVAMASGVICCASSRMAAGRAQDQAGS